MKYFIAGRFVLDIKWIAVILLSLVTFTMRPQSSDGIEYGMLKAGLVDIKTFEPSIVVDLKYSTCDNFVGKDMYGAFDKAFLRPEIARKLVMVQRALKKMDVKYSLVIYDAARPLSVQKTMYDEVKDTPFRRYVARPVGGGHHNFGVAVDVSILYDGIPLDMGTPFDSFSTVSHIDNEKSLVDSGKISEEAYENRLLLRNLMTEAGFSTYKREWWHFQCYTIKDARAKLLLLDF